MALTIRCPDCRKTFPWDFEVAGGWPEQCPNRTCKSRIGGDRDDDDIVMPFISTSGKTKATDKVYRDIEHGSEVRAQAAAEMTGATAAEMSALKITDLKPTTRHGDIAAPPLPAHLQKLGSFGGSNGSEHGAAVQQGPFPNAGAHARTMLNRHHNQLTRGAGTSERPALETLQPGYRHRA